MQTFMNLLTIYRVVYRPRIHDRILYDNTNSLSSRPTTFKTGFKRRLHCREHSARSAIFLSVALSHNQAKKTVFAPAEKKLVFEKLKQKTEVLWLLISADN